MIRGTISVKAFHQALSIPFELAETCRLEFSEDGIYIPAIDKSQTSNVDVNLQSDAFSRYEADGGAVGLEMNRLEEILKHSPYRRRVTQIHT
jgi:proliferating cell nuclear antigen